MRSRVAYIFLLLTMLLLPTSMRGDMLMNHLNITNGFHEGYIPSIVRDGFGNVWFATNNGIIRFDGIRSVHYPLNRQDENGGKVLRIGIGEATGDLYAATPSGLWRLRRFSDQLEQILPNMLQGRLTDVAVHQEKVFTTSDAGLIVIQGNRIDTLRFDKNPVSRHNKVEQFALDASANTLWMGTSGGLVKLNLSNMHYQTYSDALTQSQRFATKSVAVTKDAVYVATYHNGTLRFDKASGTFSHYGPLLHASVLSLQADDAGMLYAGTDGDGAIKIDTHNDRILAHYRKNGGDGLLIDENVVQCYYHDKFGIDWFGLFSSGVNYTYYNTHIFQLYSPFSDTDAPATDYGEKPGFQKDNVRALSVDGQKKFLGTDKGLVIVDESKREVRYVDIPTLGNYSVSAISKSNHRYYMGVNNCGVWNIDPSTLKASHIVDDKMANNAFISDIRPDEKGTIYIATNIGLVVYDEHRDAVAAIYSRDNSKLTNDAIRSIYPDDWGNIWIGTSDGLYIYDKSSTTIQSASTGKMADMKNIACISGYKDKIYISSGGKVIATDPDMKNTDEIYRCSNAADQILFARPDKQGRLWIATKYGLTVVDGGKTEVFNHSDNISSINHAAFFCDSTNIYIGTADGLKVIQAGKLLNSERERETTFTPILTQVKLGNAQADSSAIRSLYEHKKLAMRERTSLSFYIVLPDFALPAGRTYRYKMEGVDEDWQYTDDYSIVIYDRLPGGTHELAVEVAGHPDQCATFIISVPRNWTTLLWIMLIAAASLSAYSLRRYHLSRIKESIAGTLETIRLQKEKNKYGTTKMEESRIQAIHEKVEELMQQEIYTRSDLKLPDLAKMCACSTNELSQSINIVYGENFNQMMNRMRVEKFKQICLDTSYDKYTMDALSELCGFSSSSVFFSSFKKLTGMTPKAYMKEKR